MARADIAALLLLLSEKRFELVHPVFQLFARADYESLRNWTGEVLSECGDAISADPTLDGPYLERGTSPFTWHCQPAAIAELARLLSKRTLRHARRRKGNWELI